MTDSDDVRPEAPVQERVESVVVRRSPRYWRFIVVGALVGVVVALIATLAYPPNDQFTPLQTFGFLALLAGPIFGILGAVVALIADARSRRRTVQMEHETHRGAPDRADD